MQDMINASIEAAISTGPTASARVNGLLSGLAFIDEFAGSDDARMAAMWAEQQAGSLPGSQRKQPKLAAREININTNQPMYTGQRLEGPFGAGPLMSLEQGSQNLPNHVVKVGASVTTGPDSLFAGGPGGNVYHWMMKDICWQATHSNCQWLHFPTNTLYSAHVENNTFINFKHIMGNPSAKCLLTGMQVQGSMNIHGGYDTPFSIGGADMRWLCWINLDYARPEGLGKYLMRLNVDKTKIGPCLFLTSTQYWRVLLIEAGCNELTINGCTFEGHGTGSDAAFGTIVEIQGDVVFRDTDINQGMRNPGQAGGAPDKGVCHQIGGHTVMDGVGYRRHTGGATSSPEDYPFYYHEGGSVVFRNIRGWDGAFTPTVVTTDAADVDADDSVTVVEV